MIQTGTIAAVAVAFAKFLAVLVPSVTPDVFLKLGSLNLPGGTIELGLSNQRLVAVAMIAFLTFVNMRGVRLGAAIQTVFTVAKVGALVALIVLGLFIFRQPAISAMNFDTFWGARPWGLAMLPLVGAAMVGSLFSSDAWNNVTFAAAEVREPQKNLPRALAYGNGAGEPLYILANVAYLNVAPVRGQPNGADAFERGILFASQDRVGTARWKRSSGRQGPSSWPSRSSSPPSAATTASSSPGRGVLRHGA